MADQARVESVLNIPTLTSERLRLRAPREDDFAYCAAMWADPRVVRFIGGRPFSPEETWARLLKYLGHWSVKGFGFWIVEELATGSFVGEVGFAEHKRQISPSLEGIPEMGWALSPAKQGVGYAAEAVKTALAWADGHGIAAETACIIDVDNARSVHMAESNGFVHSCNTLYKDKPVMMFRRQRGGANYSGAR